MGDITKDLLNSILYEENGEKSEFHDYILDGIKPYLKENIQLGGGITVLTELELDDLFDENGKLKPQLGGGLIDYIKRYANISFFNRFYNQYNKLQNKFQPIADDINALHTIVDKRTGKIKGLLGEFYKSKKTLVLLNYNLKKLDASNTRDIIQYNRNIKKLNSYVAGTVNKLNIAHKYFNKEFHERKFKILKLGRVNIDQYSVLNKKLNEYQDNVEKLHLYFDKRYSGLEAEIDELRVKNEKIYTTINKKFNKFNDDRLRLDNKINRLSEKLGEVENIKLHIDNKFKSYGNFDLSIGIMIENELSNIYNKIDETIVITKGMKDNFEKMVKILVRLENSFQSLFDESKRDNKFAKKMNEFIQKVTRCYHISDLLFSQFLEIKSNYATKDFPPPNLDNDLDTAEHMFDGILLYFDEIKNVFESFVEETTGKIIIDNTTIVKFIKKMNGLQSGGAIIQSGGAYTQLGGVMPIEIMENIIYLHTYDMYAVNGDNGDNSFTGGHNLLLTQTYLRLNPGKSFSGIHEPIVYDPINTVNLGVLTKNIKPGIVMVSKEIEYMYNNNIIAKFINNLKGIINKPRPQFLGLLYKGEIYIYLINILKTGNIKIMLSSRDIVSNITKNNSYFPIDIIGKTYYVFIPENIRKLHDMDLSSIKDNDKKKKIERQQKEVFIIPFFLKLGTLDYAKELNHVKLGNNNPNALYKYDIYLPIDTLFNKVLIPYIPVNISDYKVINKTSSHKTMNEMYKNIFNSPISNVNIISIKPTELHKLMNYKYVLFFTSNIYMYDNNGKPKTIKIDDTIKTEAREIYIDYFNYQQSYYNKLKILTDINNITSENLFNNSKHINFMSGNISKDKLREYYNSDKYNNYILYFKFIYYNIINDIDVDILKIDKVEGIDSLKITTGPENELEKFIFNKLNTGKNEFSGNLIVFNALYNKIYKEKVFTKNLASIRNSYRKLDTINNNDINLIIKKKVSFIPELVGADEFYKTQKDNPEYPELSATAKLKELAKIYRKAGDFKTSSGSSGNIMISIYPGMEQLDDLPKEAKLKELKGFKKESIRQYDPTKSYGALYKMIDTLITKEGAEQIIREIKFFNQNKNDSKDGLYKNTNYTVKSLNTVYNNEGDKAGKVFYKLDFYIRTQLSNKEDKLEIYKKGGQHEYKLEFEQYKNKLDEDIKLEEEKKEKRKYNYNRE